jgi:hypothetical protein
VWTADRFSSLAPVAALRANQAPAVALAPALAAASAAGSGDAQSASQSEAEPGTRVPLSPRLAACCEIAMGVTMGYMLILML